jgi:hypothetical protein
MGPSEAETVIGTAIGTVIGYVILVALGSGLIWLGYPPEGYLDIFALGFGGLILLRMVVRALKGAVS